MDHNIVTAGDFNTSLSSVDRSFRNFEDKRHLKSHRPNRYLQNIPHKLRNTHSYAACPCNFLENLPPTRTQSKSHKYRKIEITSCILSDHNGINLDINSD